MTTRHSGSDFTYKQNIVYQIITLGIFYTLDGKIIQLTIIEDTVIYSNIIGNPALI